jgi:hypothetical protein
MDRYHRYQSIDPSPIVPIYEINPVVLGQLAQHFFKAKILQKLFSEKTLENSCFPWKLSLQHFVTSGEPKKRLL